ncbi:MAG: response regulator transcription factor [Pseudomonadota bacterium]
MSISVMLADDQTLVRQGICSLLSLSSKVHVVCEVGDGAQVVEGIERSKPDVLLLDIRMPMSGIDALKAMNAADCLVPTIILTTFDDDQLVLQGMKAGARGYLLKDVSLDSLVAAIEAVHAGGHYVQPVVTEKILKGLAGIKTDFESFSKPEELSPKEIEILRFMAGGYSNREISQAVNRSEGTIKNQVSAVLAKLGVRDRTRAVLRAIDLGLFGK